MFESQTALEELRRRGFHRVWLDNEVIDLNSSLVTRPSLLNNVVLDRLTIKDEPRLGDSIELAWKEGDRKIKIKIIGPPDTVLNFSSKLKCHECDIELANPQPLLFSFNHPLGACPPCKGFGNTLEYTEDAIVPDKELPLMKGAIEPWSKPSYRWWYKQFEKIAKKKKLRLDVPYKDLSAEVRELIFKGDSEFYGINEFFEELENKRYKLHVRVFLSRYRRPVVCTACKGSRLKSEALAFTLGGYDISALSTMSVSELRNFFSGLQLSEHEKELSSEILRQINLKIEFLIRVGLGYLILQRQTRTLSGGESQRINLSNQLASRLTATLYVLDEPTVVLHPRDTSKIIEIMKELADIGNTIIAVEHDKGVIDSADYIVELGPGGGERGGNLLYSGWRSDFLKADTLTAKYIKNTESIPVPKIRKRGSGKFLSVKGARGNNLKNIDIKIPLQTITCITGVSGSGKSSLVEDTIYNAAAMSFKVEYRTPLPFESIEGMEYLKGVKIIDQQPIGRSPRSNPVTYVKAFDHIRRLFADEPGAKYLGYDAGHFSFNTEGGRCEACKGEGYQKLEMYFFEDLYIKCDECGGRRYKPEILNIAYNGKNIHEALEMTVEESLHFFSRVPSLIRKLRLMDAVGLGYLKLGQPATTLSGGEAQRLKICSELSVSMRRDYLYILDEPSVGLHPHDIKKLLKVLNELVDAGNTVLIVEHNLDMIKCADWMIDMGPEGGEGGGSIVAEGRPEDIAKLEGSYTGRYLREYLL